MRIIIKLQSTESAYFRTTTKNKQAKNKQGSKPAKLSCMSYDPIVKKHVRFEEAKI